MAMDQHLSAWPRVEVQSESGASPPASSPDLKSAVIGSSLLPREKHGEGRQKHGRRGAWGGTELKNTATANRWNLSALIEWLSPCFFVRPNVDWVSTPE